MLRQLRRGVPPLVGTAFFMIFINCVISRSIADPDDFTIDKSEVPARYVYEIDEVTEESSDIKKSTPTNRGYSDSGLMFDMPIAVAIFSAVMLLICCFCCLRCAVSYDGVKTSGFYGGPKKSNVVDIARKLKPNSHVKK